MEQLWIQSHLINVSSGPTVLFWPLWLDRVGKKPSIKADLIYLLDFYCVLTMLECGYYNYIRILIFVCTRRIFPNPVTYVCVYIHMYSVGSESYIILGKILTNPLQITIHLYMYVISVPDI